MSLYIKKSVVMSLVYLHPSELAVTDGMRRTTEITANFTFNFSIVCGLFIYVSVNYTFHAYSLEAKWHMWFAEGVNISCCKNRENLEVSVRNSFNIGLHRTW